MRTASLEIENALMGQISTITLSSRESRIVIKRMISASRINSRDHRKRSCDAITRPAYPFATDYHDSS
ncbi:hypothetical protein CA85_34770 [Allorhodopirellula solitaria]|uniref:Uncharacterized protein n=1 Tax=Allorhodopirellula solitaria TaxID=2527987 RepID=A0A5C5XQE6_9BACT|nr:hypothetical protein CA85_34770 [Allorhodopirellula solitaria]